MDRQIDPRSYVGGVDLEDARQLIDGGGAIAECRVNEREVIACVDAGGVELDRARQRLACGSEILPEKQDDAELLPPARRRGIERERASQNRRRFGETLLAGDCRAQRDVQRRVRGGCVDRAAPAGLGIRELTGTQQQLAHVVPREHVRRVGVDGAAEQLDRRGRVALDRARQPQVRERHALARVDLERLLIVRDRTIEIALLRKQEAEVVVRGGVAGIALDRRGVRRARPFEIAAQVLPRALVACRARLRIDGGGRRRLARQRKDVRALHSRPPITRSS